jgi:MFS family permease
VRATWRVLAGHRDFRLVLSAGVISQTGDWILMIGLLYRVYAMTGSTLASAVTLLAVHGGDQLWIVCSVVAWEAAVQQLFTPAELALVPALLVFGFVTSIGGIVGGLFAAPLAQRFSATRLFTVSAVVFGAIDLGIFLYPVEYRALWPAFAGMILVGLPGALNMAALITLFERSTAAAYRGRIFGAMNAVFSVGSLAGPLAAGYLSGTFGIVPVIAEQGAGYVLCGLAMMVALRHVRAGSATSGELAAPTPKLLR